ncbi:MAG: tyrosine-type recombinase/integrase [Candidatus Eisenbacteria bacterium]
MRLSTAIRRFDTQLRADGKSDHTRGSYLRNLQRFKGWLRTDKDVAAITPDTLAQYCASGQFTGRRTISINHTKSALRMFFSFLTDAGHIEINPARLIKNGRCGQKTPEHFTKQEIRNLLATIPPKDGPVARRDRVMFTLLLQTGIRLGSLVQLRVVDANLSRGAITIKAKGGTEQSVYVNSDLRRLLRSYIKRSGLSPESPLFPSRNGDHLSHRQVQLRFKHWLGEAGIKRHLTVHSLRHTFAMNLYRNTGDLRLVQTALGHKHVSTTEIYARVEDKALRRALEKL